ncbi:MAG: hypothetical protein AAGF20_06730 [Pseudomonadota bacterium]
MICYPVPLTAAAFRELDRAVKRDGHCWKELTSWLSKGVAQVWSISGHAYVLTLANEDEEIEVLLAGGERAKECVGPWEAAMRAHPAHRGKTLRIEGRKGWSRLLKHWDRRDGVLYLKV